MPKAADGWKNWNLARVGTAQMLWSAGVFEVGDVVLADGTASPYKINLRLEADGGPLQQVVIDALGQDLRAYAEEHDLLFEWVCGVPSAGDCLAEAFSRHGNPLEEFPVDVIHLKKSGGHIVDILDTEDADAGASETALLIDDAITHSYRKDQAIEVLQAGGFVVYDVLVVMDREEGAREALAERGVTLHSLFVISDFLDFGYEYGMVAEENYRRISAYIREHRV